MTDLPELNNTYYSMRHGRSIPNSKGIIVAHPSNGTLSEYGLVEEGIHSAERSSFQSGFSPNTVIVSTDFSRGRQTADILCEIIGAEGVVVDSRLRERSFGDMELGSDSLYREVWARDASDATHAYRGVESLNSLAARQMELITELEKEFARRVIVLVSHADPINVLKASLWGLDVRTHRQALRIETAEIQQLSTVETR